jgi:ferredoxin--NADP+ reductase
LAQLELNAVVSQRIEVAPGLIIIRVRPEGWELPDFLPGQFAVLGLPCGAPRCEFSDPEPPPADPEKLLRRSYSIASSSKAKEYLEFYVALVHSGTLSPRLFALEPGHKVWLGKKFTGLFTLEQVPPEVNLVMIATGTGIAPYMSMLRTQIPLEERRRLAVLHGARHSWDLGYGCELIALQKQFPTFTYIPIISKPEEELEPWRHEAGYVQDLWTRRALDVPWGFRPAPENTHVFLCGNPAMVDQTSELLQGEGFREHSRREAGQIHVERYW